jgi:hypothetical protein
VGGDARVSSPPRTSVESLAAAIAALDARTTRAIASLATRIRRAARRAEVALSAVACRQHRAPDRFAGQFDANGDTEAGANAGAAPPL